MSLRSVNTVTVAHTCGGLTINRQYDDSIFLFNSTVSMCTAMCTRIITKYIYTLYVYNMCECVCERERVIMM